MLPLIDEARSFLEAAGFKATKSDTDFLRLEPAARGATGPRLLIWSDSDALLPSHELGGAQRAARDAREQALLTSFAREMRATPDAIGYYLVDRRLGLSQHFVTEATRLLGERGGIRVPAEFFDTSYKIERSEARRARSVLGDVLASATRVRRVPQPFTVRTGLSGASRAQPGADLVAHLAATLLAPQRAPKLHLIDGAAGNGKTVAFNALAAGLYAEFVAAKRARQERARPIVFLPEHLRGQRTGYVDDIIAAMAETDVAELTSPEQFRWLLKSGRSVWMFDGLDEFYAGSTDFLSFVDAMLTAPGSKAQFIICARDSLLSSSPVMREFIERHLKASDRIGIYELSPWTSDGWKELAWLELEDGREGARGSARVERFVAALQRSPEVAALARVPFYCAVLIGQFKKNQDLPHDELDVLELLVSRMIDREHGKHIFQWQDFVDFEGLLGAFEQEVAAHNIDLPEKSDLDSVIRRLLDEEGREILFDLIGGIAHRMQRTPGPLGGAPGISTEDVRGLLKLGRISVNPDPAVLRRLRIALVQFAFFGPGRRAGSLDFTHQILAEYFAARFAGGMLARAAAGDAAVWEAAIAEAIGAADVAPQSLFHRYLARKIESDAGVRRMLEFVAERGGLGQRNVRDAVQLLLAAGSGEAKHDGKAGMLGRLVARWKSDGAGAGGEVAADTP